MPGKQFRMSRRMSRTKPDAFGLESAGMSGLYRDRTDGSIWQQKELFDFGWGREPGYSKLPLPSIEGLVKLLFAAENEDDRFGAAGILLEECAEEALPYFEAMLTNPETREAAARRLREISLGESRNRSRIIGKSVEQVEADFERWSSIAAGIAEKTE